MEAYKGDKSLAKQIEQSRVSLSIAAKMLERMRENQKRHYKNRKSVHTLKVGDLVLLRKHNKDKLELKWESNYRIIRLPHGQLLLKTNLLVELRDAMLVILRSNTQLRIGI